MSRPTNRFGRLLREEDGAALLEYGLLVLLIAAVCLVAVTTFGSKTASAWTTTNGAIP